MCAQEGLKTDARGPIFFWKISTTPGTNTPQGLQPLSTHCVQVPVFCKNDALQHVPSRQFLKPWCTDNKEFYNKRYIYVKEHQIPQ